MSNEIYVIYTSLRVPNCSHCKKAKELLSEFGIPYTEISIGKDISKEDFQKKYGPDVKTVPQITIDGKRIGGYDGLYERLRGRK